MTGAIITRRTSRWSPWKAWHLWYGLPAEQRDLGRRGLSEYQTSQTRPFWVPKFTFCGMKRQKNGLHHSFHCSWRSTHQNKQDGWNLPDDQLAVESAGCHQVPVAKWLCAWCSKPWPDYGPYGCSRIQQNLCKRCQLEMAGRHMCMYATWCVSQPACSNRLQSLEFLEVKQQTIFLEALEIKFASLHLHAKVPKES